ncbi:MAG: hypothetical protein GKR87_05585 [Kiritimatiellae bacterium]|nr:hypothetical protein [Kiritimatiellia bacterium]
MCTVTWLHDTHRYEVFFNRDEQRTRLPASPPQIRIRNHMKYMAPIDEQAGGSWIGVNEGGLTPSYVSSIIIHQQSYRPCLHPSDK